MAAAQDAENPQMFLNSPGPSASQNVGRGPRIAESLRVEVTVLRAHNVPHVKNLFGLKFFVAVTDQTTKKKTSSVPTEGAVVQWNENLGVFILQPSSRLVLRLYAERFARRDILIGRHEMIPVESQTDFPFILTNDDGKVGQPIQLVMLYLTVIVSPNATNLRFTEVNDFPSGEATRPSMALVSTDTSRPTVTTGSETRPPPMARLPSDVSTPPPAADRGTGMSPAKNALRDADEAMTIDLSNTLEGVLESIKWVMDAVSSVAELHPYAKMAYGLLFAIPKNSFNVTITSEPYLSPCVMRLISRTGKIISKPSSMFPGRHRSLRSCCSMSVIAVTLSNRKRILKNTGGQVDKKIEDFRSTLLALHKAFLDEAAITTEITALQILDDVGIISAQLDGMATQLKWVSNQVSDTEMDAKIREIPYGTGSRFAPDKGCLAGTRTAFLDFIVDWVNDPASERCLVLFGQAGTGKSCIAHEIAHRFDKIHRLTSSFIFLRKEQSKREAYHLFMTLARDLSDRYPSFKTALGRLVKDNSSLRVGTRDYGTLFQKLILEPLKDLHIVGPILVVIDALDESGDATGSMGLHTFLAENLIRLPSNFRVLITARPEPGIVPALVGAPSVTTRYMKDSELAAKTADDIVAFLRERLPSDEFTNHGDALAIKAEGLFQWAAVAGQLILNPPGRFGYSKKKVIRHLLRHGANRDGQDPLDELYKEVLEGYITGQEARVLFRTVMGQLITAIEPLSIRSLTTLQRYADSDDADDGDAIVILIRRLGSLLSNVDSPDENLPIVPLHTSFRDFLTNEDKSGKFCVDISDARRQLAHSCVGLLLEDLKFNICNLETSHLANKDVVDLNSRIDEHLPPALLYACRFWGDHLEYIDFEAGLFGKLRSFFSKKLLFWLEALSLTNYMGLASAACKALSVWLASSQDVSIIQLLIW
ncbi:hypothetical protein EDB84DRAFT_629161 [Lactarius hengduanensis]|nr:hypothetical protein EDB84DRAFT_629161 [Lactarius hengduanensis]